ncbi:MAG: SOS response-associated peptidase [Opitutaceae bacterium]|jgi:putative SOS response-associated peptidase YedK|nr:SOS response-associated peptidase [Opitutaceae bacterium]
MCTRFLLEQARLRALAAALALPASAAEVIAPRDRFNIAPGRTVSALRSLTGVFHPHWGFAPRAAGQAPLVNARAESLAERPAFREAYRARRCLVPATGFYEWQKLGRARLPWLFRIENPDTPGTPAPFCLAGLWERAPDGDGGVPSLVVVTTAANAVMAPIHDRMPALLHDAAACRAWLDPRTSDATLDALLAPAPAAILRATPVSPRVNHPDFDSPECLAPAVHGLAARDRPDDDGHEFAFP